MQKYEYWLQSLVDIGNNKKFKLEEYFGSAKNVYFAGEKALASSKLLKEDEIQYILDNAKDKKIEGYYQLEKSGISFIGHKSPHYPRPLSTIPTKPYGLFVKGTLPQSWDFAIAMVGSRKNTAYGRIAAEDIATALSKAGGLVISGMAKGIDAASHSGALRVKAPTVAVLGCGVDVCYPLENKNLYHCILEGGAIISEFPPNTAPLPLYFPLRNRIISGLCKVTIVIEAADKSGSLITSDFALEQGRDVFALPGRINDPLSAGTNHLIEQGAGIITSCDSLLKTLRESGHLPPISLNPAGFSHKKSPGSTGPGPLNQYEYLILSAIDYTPIGVNAIADKVGLPIPLIIDTLVSLEKSKLIKESVKNHYVKNYL